MVETYSITFGGISILNAIPCLKGIVMAIELPVITYVKMLSSNLIEIHAYDKNYVNYVINYFKSKYKLNNIGLKILIESSIPPKSGLKSSSAVTIGLVDAISKIFNLELNTIEKLKISAILSKNYGISITGAFDDLSASYLGGIQFTDNEKMLILKSLRIENDLNIIIIILEKFKRKYVDTARLRKLKSIFEKLFNYANYDLWKVLTINGFFISQCLDYDYSIIEKIKKLSNDILAIGISGNGPAITIILPGKKYLDLIDNIEKLFINERFTTIITKPINLYRFFSSPKNSSNFSDGVVHHYS